jgi:serine/threonine-protein kinase HipA
LYDVLSAWPVIGKAPNLLQIQQAKLAMAISGKNRHYGIVEIQGCHWHELALRVGGPTLWSRMLLIVEAVNAVIDRIVEDLPSDFPAKVSTKIAEGVRGQARKFLNSVPGA